MALLIACNIVAILIPAANCTRHLLRTTVLSRAHWTRWPGRAALAEVLATTLPGLGFSVIYASINWLLMRTLIERQQGADQFNQYAIGLQWFSLVLFVPLAFGQVLFPRFVQKARSRSLGLAEIVAPPAFTFGLVLVCALVAAVLAPLVSWAYGGRYAFTGTFVFTILLAAALSGAVNLLGSFVMAARGFGAWLLINVASAATAAGLLWALPVDTALGAAQVLCLIQLTPVVLAGMLVVRHRTRHPVSHGSREEVVAVPAATPLNDGR
jgi:O-antigen/teichoic acid export membrane protein